MQDWLLDIDGDLKIDANGALVSGLSDNQHQRLLVMVNKGGFKENPTSTVGVWNYLEAESPADLFAEIHRCFAADGMSVNDIQFNKAGNLVIDANYNS